MIDSIKECPKFFDGQVVTTTDKHFTQHKVVIVFDVTQNSNGDYLYFNEYCHYENGSIIQGGGCSGLWKEDDFKEVDNIEIKLAIEKFYKTKETEKIEKRLKVLKEEIEKIKYCQNLLKLQVETEKEGLR